MTGEPIRSVAGTGIPIEGDDVDTDRILPARFLKTTTFEGMADHLFHDDRLTDGEPNDHPLNRDRYADASIAVVNDNFGCGSSREHAPQAMARWGIDGIVGASFADIFRDNCTSIGLPAATVAPETARTLQSWVADNPDGRIELDVAAGELRFGGRTVPAELDASAREALLGGSWDTTAVMRANADLVAETAAALPYVGTADPSGGTAGPSGERDGVGATDPSGGPTDPSGEAFESDATTSDGGGSP